MSPNCAHPHAVLALNFRTTRRDVLRPAARLSLPSGCLLSRRASAGRGRRGGPRPERRGVGVSVMGFRDVFRDALQQRVSVTCHLVALTRPSAIRDVLLC